MDVPILKKGLNFSRRNKNWLLLFALFGASGYGVYKAYHLPSVARKRERLAKLVRAFVSLSELVSESAETISVVSKDLNKFLNSDTDEIPNSLKQLSKITTSKEFSASLSRVSEALTVGILLGCKSDASNDAKHLGIRTNPNGLTDTVLERLFSKAGTGFASVVVGSFARNLVLGFRSADFFGDELNSQSKASSDVPAWVNIVCDEKCGKLIGDIVQIFVSTAVSIFLERTMDVNNFDEMFSGMTNPKHEEKVKGILVSLCSGAVETFVRTSHQVLVKSKSSSNSSLNLSPFVLKDDGPILSENRCLDPTEAVVLQSKPGGSVGGVQDAGWFDQIKSTISVPANRNFVLDVTGRVTMETTRSIVALLLWRLSDGLKRNMKNIHDEAVDKGFEVVRYVGAKSSVMLTLFIAFYLHILGGSTIVLPA